MGGEGAMPLMGGEGAGDKPAGATESVAIVGQPVRSDVVGRVRCTCACGKPERAKRKLVRKRRTLSGNGRADAGEWFER
jgi:hypothetical protein